MKIKLKIVELIKWEVITIAIKMFTKICQLMKGNIIKDSIVMQAGGDINVDKALLESLLATKQNSKLLNKLVLEKNSDCYRLILEKKITAANAILETIFNYGLVDINRNNLNKLYLHRGLIYILKGQQDNLNDCLEILKDCDKNYESILISISKMYLNNFEDIEKLIAEIDLPKKEATFFILDALFQYGKFEKIINEFKPNHTSTEWHNYVYALTLLNEGELFNAIKYLKICQNFNCDERYEFFMLVGEVPIIIDELSRNKGTNPERLSEIVEDLLDMEKRHIEIIEIQCEVFIMTLLRALLFSDIEKYFEKYNELNENQKNSYNIKLLMSTYYELNDDYKKALVILEELYIQLPNEEIFFKILFLNLMLENYLIVIDKYDRGINYDSNRIIGIYLTAINYEKPDIYMNRFNLEIEKHKSDIDFYFHAYISTCNNMEAKINIFNKIYPELETIKTHNNKFKLTFASLALQVDELDFCKNILLSINNFNEVGFIQLYNILSTANDIEFKVEVINELIKKGIKSEILFSIKADCLISEGKNISALIQLKEIFNIAPSKKIASSILDFTNQKDCVTTEDYQPYLDYLRETDDPLTLVLRAIVYCRLGQYEISNLLSYKALFKLKNEINPQVFDAFLSVHMNALKYFENLIIHPERIIDNVVFQLMPVSDEDKSILSFCINQEEEYQADVFAIDTQHISKNNLLYLISLNKKVGDRIKFQNKLYRIENIINKYVYALRYVLGKASQNIYNSRIILKTIRTSDQKELTQQLKDTMSDEKEENNQIEKYHFEDNELGLPIELLVNCNYDMYLRAVKFLLFNDEQGLYAGINSEMINKEKKIVVSLTTVVVLKCINRLNLLDLIKEQIIIPKSLYNNIRTRSENASASNVVSPGSLSMTVEGNIILIPNDKTEVEFWNSIFSVVKEFKIIDVSDKERIDIGYEELFLNWKIHNCQIDCLVIARNYNADYLCDDLFFRRIGATLNINTYNFTILYSLLSNEQIPDEIIELAKTNYFYIPIHLMSEDMVLKLVAELFSSNRKKELYNHYLHSLGLI